MKLTPSLLEAAYEFLRVTPPFRAWRMPAGSYVEFKVSKSREALGTYQLHPRSGLHVITISGARISYVSTLMSVMAHEMVHLHQMHHCTTTKSEHNAGFHRLSKIVCRHHGWDPLEF